MGNCQNVSRYYDASNLNTVSKDMDEAIKTIVNTFLKSSKGNRELNCKAFWEMVSLDLCYIIEDTRDIRQIIAKNRSGKVSFKEYFSVISFLADSLRRQRMTGSNPTDMEQAIVTIVNIFVKSAKGKEDLDSKAFWEMASNQLDRIMGDTRAIQRRVGRNCSGKVSFKEYFDVTGLLADSLMCQTTGYTDMEAAVMTIMDTFFKTSKGRKNLDSKTFRNMLSSQLGGVSEEILQGLDGNSGGKVSFQEYFHVIGLLANSRRCEKRTGSIITDTEKAIMTIVNIFLKSAKGKGDLDHEDFQEIVSHHLAGISEDIIHSPAIQEMLEGMGKNSGGKVSFQEYLILIGYLANSLSNREVSQQKRGSSAYAS